MMICTVIKGPTIKDVHQQISQAITCSDMIELRLDYFEDWNPDDLKELRKVFFIPMLFTLRSKLEGGNYPFSEEKRLVDIEVLASLQPEYMDLESFVSGKFIYNLSEKYPTIKFIISYHNFHHTPLNLDAILMNMRKTPAHYYKIAVTSKSTVEALKFLCWTKIQENLIGISMGPYGQISRILAPIVGIPITYASLEEQAESAPGQLPACVLIDKYRYHSLSKKTAIYGLIGKPVDKSISDITHNAFFKTSKVDAVYIKMQVTPEELPELMVYAKQLPFKGLSVTMPLKEHVLKYLDHIDFKAREIGAINTLVFNGDEIAGYNTDCFGALDPIEEVCKVKNKRIVIIGAGGAAKAIAYEAKCRGAIVTILNRNKERAINIAKELGCIGKSLDEMNKCAKEGYDILINCTPVAMPISSDHILPNVVAMDIMTKPKETVFLNAAKEKGCKLVDGEQMFFAQADGQFKLWEIS
jgi:3-dehydroquinate dehydratase/shikimate dehydrogenase